MLTRLSVYKRSTALITVAGILLMSGMSSLDAISAAHAAPAAPVKVSREVGEPLKAATELAQSKDYKGALAKLDAAAAKASTPAEKYQISTVRRYIYAQTKDYAKLAETLEAQLTSGMIPEAEVKPLRKELAQVYDRAGNTAQATKAAKTYISTYGHDPDLAIYVAAKALETKDYKSAAEWAGKAIDGEVTAGRTPPETWYKIGMKAAYENGDMAGYYDAMEKAVVRYPSDTYWRALATRGRTQKGYSIERLELDEFRLMSAAGVKLTADEKLGMAEAAFERELSAEALATLLPMSKNGELEADPAKAARNLRLLNKAKADTEADSAALSTIVAEASKKNDGLAIANVAELSLSLGDAKGAVALYQSALTKPGLDAAAANAFRLRLGIAQYRAGDIAGAKKTWTSIKGTDGAQELARGWLLIAGRG